MNKFTAFLSLILLPFLSYSQNYGDCSSAFHFTDFTEILEFQPTDNGMVNDDFNTEDCVSAESLSTWIKFTVPTEGNFFFTIKPKNEGDDIDFAVYKTPSLDDCDNRETLRCMASGEQVGSDSSACMGDTGLSEDETDLVENPGCAPDDNNFVAAIDAQAGDTYLIFINNFSNTGAPYCIEFLGSGLINTLSTSDFDKPKKIELYPNPAHTRMYTSLADGTRYSILSILGLNLDNDLVKDGQIDISELPLGNYILSAEGHNRAFIKI